MSSKVLSGGEEGRRIHSIAHIENGFSEKFGIPRQSGLAPSLEARIVLEPEYRIKEAVRGLEEYSHIWLLWEFSEAVREDWSPTVRPPRLGGNQRMGVFATRSPFRPNPIGLSSVRLVRVDWEDSRAPVLIVAGADLMDHTPIYDIKPYLAFTDSHPEALGGFADRHLEHKLEVEISPEWMKQIPQELQEGLMEILAQDPRPGYQRDPNRIYGLGYAGWEIRFQVEDNHLVVREVRKSDQ